MGGEPDGHLGLFYGLTVGDFAIFAGMGSDFFRFKRFEVCQAKAAMKVCTDACLFGGLLAAWTPDALRVLDIGTGTGLLSLMYAQANERAEVDALELDSMAFLQASENFSVSPFDSRLKAIKGDFREFARRQTNAGASYDLIFSNPPFFEGDLKSPDYRRNQALHSTELGFADLLAGVRRHLSDGGTFAVLIPYARTEVFVDMARGYGLYPFKWMKIAQSTGRSFFRSVLLLSGEQRLLESEQMVIREANQQYSLKFTELLRPYYLYL